MTGQDAEKKLSKGALRNIVLQATILLLAVMTVLSAYGAFLGAQKASAFFNSPPLAAFWALLTFLFCAGFFTVKSLVKKPGLLLSHLGCLLVLLGALWGSEAAHKLRARHFGSAKTREGYMQIHEGHQENRIYAGDGSNTVRAELPFNVALDDFWIDYYASSGRLQVEAPDGQTMMLEAKAGKEADFGEGVPKLKIKRTFENFKITMDAGQKTVSDAGGAGVNPALEVEITVPGGQPTTRYVFSGTRGEHGFTYDGLNLAYLYGGGSQIKDFKSALSIVENGEVVLRKTIEVNDPLHYGGYDFYQSGYDQEHGHYTVLSVTSDSGLMLVFGGYFLLCLGVIWQCWLRHLGSRGAALA